RRLAADRRELEPLLGEARHERTCARIGEHPPDLTLELCRGGQLAGDCAIEQLVVGEAGPEKQREPRRERDIVEWIRLARRGAGRRRARRTEQELRAAQDSR